MADKTIKLTQRKDGNFAIIVNGAVLGQISANPKGAFVIPDGYDELGKPKAKVYEAGTHTIEYNGKKYSLVVKDLQLRFAPVDDVHNNEIEAKRAGLPMYEYMNRVNKANEEAFKELMDRVTLTEV